MSASCPRNGRTEARVRILWDGTLWGALKGGVGGGIEARALGEAPKPQRLRG